MNGSIARSTNVPSVPGKLVRNVRLYLEMVRFSHTIFALPFSLLAAIWAWAIPVDDLGPEATWPIRVLGILLCMVFARNFAMSINRWSDATIDAKNPRTANRHIPSGKLSSKAVLTFAVVNGLAFHLSCLMFLPNRLPIFLAIPVLAFLAGYSFAKRFTSAVHFWLGVALMLAPICTWIALRGHMVQKEWVDLLPAIGLGGVVLLWVAGFDIIYACQDEKIDRELSLHSIPARIGVKHALRFATCCHLGMWLLLALFPFLFPSLSLGGIWGVAVVIIGLLLALEHRIVSEKDLSKVNIAFFHLNAVISSLLLLAGSVDALWR